MIMFSQHEDYVRPYWLGGRILNESVMPLYHKGETGDIRIRLMNRIETVESVRTATLETTFTEGIDYTVDNGDLIIKADGHIRIMPWEEYNPAEGTNFNCTLGGKLIFGEANNFHRIQYAVTYLSADNIFEGRYIPTASEHLDKTRAILDASKDGSRDLKLSFFGDSITYGCNASGLGVGVPPFMPVYPLLAAETLRRRGYGIDYYNPSIGGRSSPWGRQTTGFYFDEFQPDVTVIAFGMNDGSGRLPVADFIANHRAMIARIREKNPDAEFILVTTTLPNPIADHFSGIQRDYQKPIAELAAEEHCALLDMTELHSMLLERIEYHHMTGNNINHPTDFLARLYTQGVLALIGR